MAWRGTGGRPERAPRVDRRHGGPGPGDRRPPLPRVRGERVVRLPRGRDGRRPDAGRSRGRRVPAARASARDARCARRSILDDAGRRAPPRTMPPGAHPVPGGFSVEVPPWRPDLLTGVDVAEDVVLARGVRSEDGVVPPSGTRGRRRAETVFRRTRRGAPLGPRVTPNSTPRSSSGTPSMASSPPRRRSDWGIRPPTSSRSSGTGSPVPPDEPGAQRAPPVPPADVPGRPGGRSGPGVGDRWPYDDRARAACACERAGFADGAALLDYLTGALGTTGSGSRGIPGTIRGRAARLRLAGEVIGEVGEVHPAVLTELRVPVPVVWAELDLSALWPLVRRGEAD